jgi:uncharacterized membrane protein
MTHIILSAILSIILLVVIFVVVRMHHRAYKQLLKDANIVTGEDAARLQHRMDNPTSISDEERKRMKENYERFNIKN